VSYVVRVPFGADEVAIAPSQTLEELVRAQQADLAALRVTMDKDLFWRRVGTIATIAGTVFAAAKLVDILVAIRRRGSGAPAG